MRAGVDVVRGTSEVEDGKAVSGAGGKHWDLRDHGQEAKTVFRGAAGSVAADESEPKTMDSPERTSPISVEGRHWSVTKLVVEVLLVAIGVFLGLLANNWHEDREHKALAQATLRNFAAEMRTNREATQRTRVYHATLVKELEQFTSGPGPWDEAHFQAAVHFMGVQPVIYEHTAWDLALATQALNYLNPNLAFTVSKTYTKQNAFQTVENSFLFSTFTPAALANENYKGLAMALMIYMIDVNDAEPAMIKRYDEVIPQVDAALHRKR